MEHAAEKRIYDTIILGGGPAGLSAGLYAGRARLKALIIEGGRPGGQIAITSEIENYPGSMPEESGPSLMERFYGQAKRLGAEICSDRILSVELSGPVKSVICSEGVYHGRTVIIATGAEPVHIGCPGEDTYAGKGVSYCATCDGAFFTDLEVFVVGGGDAALEEAMYLTRFARTVTVIHRRDALRAARSIQEKAFACPKLRFMWNAAVKQLGGEDGLLTSMVVEDTQTGAQREIKADEQDGLFGLFVFIGYRPNTGIFDGQLTLEKGYIPTSETMETSIPGVFAAGDVRVKAYRQVVTAAADGAIAAMQAGRYLDAT